MPATPKTSAELLARELSTNGISARQFSQITGKHHQSILKMKNGVIPITNDRTIHDFSRVLNINPDLFYALNEQVPEDIRDFLKSHPIIWSTVRKVMAIQQQRDEELAEKKAADAKARAATLAAAKANTPPPMTEDPIFGLQTKAEPHGNETPTV